MATVIQVHGLGEHGGRYQPVAEHMVGHGIAFLGYDHAGHGKSSGARGHIPSYEHLLDEVDLAINLAEEMHPGLPLFLYGHSWGGNIALNHLLRRKPKLTGAIITGPWLKLPSEPPAFKVLLGNMMRKMWPSFSQDTNLDHRMLTHDQAMNAAYKADPLVHSKISALNYFSSADAAQYALQNAGNLDLPTLLMHGKDDAITSCKGSQEFAQKAKQVRFLEWEGLYHEIHNEPEAKEKVWGHISDFISEKI